MMDIVLLPIVKTPAHAKDFQPITLCNSIYKILAKILSNRLCIILPNIISDNQVGFVKGRLITNATMVRFDVLHHIYAYKATNNMTLKLI